MEGVCKAFTRDGGEVDSCEEILPNDVLYMSCGEAFVSTAPPAAASTASTSVAAGLERTHLSHISLFFLNSILTRSFD